METVYNIDTLVRTFADVIRLIPDARLTLAGSGSQRNVLEAEAGENNVTESVRFLGDVSHAGVPALLRDHAIFISIALSDTTSVSLLEAMACGLFPIVSDIPANREWIEHGTNGFLVPPRDSAKLAGAIVDAWRNPELRSEAAKKNADLIEARADWFHNMATVKELFNRIVSR
jgi:glycosyltransferase involved in cell wall biosynthesis